MSSFSVPALCACAFHPAYCCSRSACPRPCYPMAVSLAMHRAGQLEFRVAPLKPDERTRKLRETSFGRGRLLCAQKLPLAGSKLQLPLYFQKQTQLGSRGRSETCRRQTCLSCRAILVRSNVKQSCTEQLIGWRPLGIVSILRPN
jgi:hypothetical protein